MPPRRKAVAASAVKTQTLHSFSTVGKNVPKSGKPTGKARISKETKEKEAVKNNIALVPAFEIKQEGDEDVIVKREVPTPTPTKVKPTKTESPKVKPAKAEPKEVEKVEPETAEPAKAKAKSARKVKPEKPVPSIATPGGKRKRTLPDDFVSSPAKKREIKPLKGSRPITPPPTSSPAPPEDPLAFVSTKSTDLPEDLTLLQSLHSSLLTALLLHRAHHSNSTHPPAFSAIKLHVERLCRRKITLEDVRRIVYLSHYSPETQNEDEHFDTEGGLKLIDYGSNKICIDFAEKTKARKLVNSDNLKKDFLSRTHCFFDESNKAQAMLPTPPSSFAEPLPTEEEDVPKTEIEEAEAAPAPLISLHTVPLAKIHTHAKATTISKVLHTKGQQRLDDLLRRTKPALLSSPIKAKTAGAPVARGNSLLSRIRAKAEAAALAASNAPSKEEQERDAACQRIPDIEPILKGLASRGNNMTMKSVVEGIRESVRNPVSCEQAEMVVRLIAERGGANGWVKVREVGKVVGVVFGKRAEDSEFM